MRTFVRDDDQSASATSTFIEPDVPFAEVGTPTWDGLPLDSYLSLLDMLNPMHRLWSDGRWNKLTVAHGCYWKKCSFCDVSLDYISRFDGVAASTLVDRIEAIVAGNRADRLSFRRRSRAAEGAEGARRGTEETPARDLVVGQYSLREIVHPGALPGTRRQRLHRDLRRARGRVRPAAQADEKGRHRSSRSPE